MEPKSSLTVYRMLGFFPREGVSIEKPSFEYQREVRRRREFSLLVSPRKHLIDFRSSRFSLKEGVQKGELS